MEERRSYCPKAAHREAPIALLTLLLFICCVPATSQKSGEHVPDEWVVTFEQYHQLDQHHALLLNAAGALRLGRLPSDVTSVCLQSTIAHSGSWWSGPQPRGNTLQTLHCFGCRPPKRHRNTWRIHCVAILPSAASSPTDISSENCLPPRSTAAAAVQALECCAPRISWWRLLGLTKCGSPATKALESK